MSLVSLFNDLITPSEPQTRAAPAPTSTNPSPPASDCATMASLCTSYRLPPASTCQKSKSGHIPRPPNAFILYRSDALQRIKRRQEQIISNPDATQPVETKQQVLSRIVGESWNLLGPEEKAEWHAKAKEAMAEHARLYPDYRFTPTPRGMGKTSKRKQQRERSVRFASGWEEQDHESGEDDKHRVRRLRELYMDVPGPAVCPPRRARRTRAQTPPAKAKPEFAEYASPYPHIPSTLHMPESPFNLNVDAAQLPPFFPQQTTYAHWPVPEISLAQASTASFPNHQLHYYEAVQHEQSFMYQSPPSSASSSPSSLSMPGPVGYSSEWFDSPPLQIARSNISRCSSTTPSDSSLNGMMKDMDILTPFVPPMSQPPSPSSLDYESYAKMPYMDTQFALSAESYFAPNQGSDYHHGFN